MSIESVILSNHLILSRPLPLLPSVFPSIRVFSNESVLHIKGPKYWSFNFSISPSNEHPGLISLMVGSPCCPRDSQESSPTPQFESINSSVLSPLYSPTLTSISYMTTGKTIALTRQTSVDKVMSLLFSYHIFRFASPHGTKPPMRAGSTAVFSSVYPQPPRPDIKSAPNEYLSNGQKDFWLFSQSWGQGKKDCIVSWGL